MAYKITDKCISCGACAGACPVSCITQGEGKYEIDPNVCISCGTCPNVCISCGTCKGVCPVDAPEEE